MKHLKTLLLFSLLICCLCGCQHSDKKAITASINQELSLLNSDDPVLISSYFENSTLLENLDQDVLPREIVDTLQLFYKDFSYSIGKIDIAKDKLHASVNLKLTTIDAQSLAKDFSSASMINQLQNQAAPSAVEYSLEDYFVTLHTVLTDHTYELVEHEYTITLTKHEDLWTLDPDSNLSNAMTGGFISASADPDLFTPEEVITLHFDTIKSFDSEQLNRFLSLNDLFSSDDEYKYEIAKAMAKQMLEHLDYEILSAENDGINATATVRVTTCDWNQIISQYSKQMTEYTATSQALADGFSARLTKAYDILLNCLNANTASTDSELVLTLVNNGTNWKLLMDDAFAEALLGNVDEAMKNIAT